MATEYDLKLVVDADTSEAQRKLDALAEMRPTPEAEQAAERVRGMVARPEQDTRLGETPRSTTRLGETPRPTTPPPSVQTPRPATRLGETPRPTTPPPSVQTPRPTTPAPPVQTPQQFEAGQKAKRMAESVREIRAGRSGSAGNAPEDFGRKAGDVAGRMIGKAVAGFVAHEVAGVVFNGLKTVGGDNRGVNQAEAGVGGALRYGTMGAMLGGPLGAIIGSIAGAGMGFFQEQQRQDKAVEARDQAIKDADYGRNRDAAIGAADSAFGRSLELAGGWRQRQEMIRARRDEIASGDGSWSIKSLKETLKGLDPESSEGKRVAANLELQKNRVTQLDRQLLDEGLAVAPSRLEPGDVTDSLAKRGIQVGAQVDVAQVNEKIMGEVQSCRALLEKIANMANDGPIGMSKMLSAVYD